MDIENYQGNAVINICDPSPAYSRIIEHKHFEFGQQSKTVITKEYPIPNNEGAEPYYPINDYINTNKYNQYKELAKEFPNVIFGGRLAEYRYYDMHQVVASALVRVKKEFE